MLTKRRTLALSFLAPPPNLPPRVPEWPQQAHTLCFYVLMLTWSFALTKLEHQSANWYKQRFYFVARNKSIRLNIWPSAKLADTLYDIPLHVNLVSQPYLLSIGYYNSCFTGFKSSSNLYSWNCPWHVTDLKHLLRLQACRWTPVDTSPAFLFLAAASWWGDQVTNDPAGPWKMIVGTGDNISWSIYVCVYLISVTSLCHWSCTFQPLKSKIWIAHIKVFFQYQSKMLERLMIFLVNIFCMFSLHKCPILLYLHKN